MLRWFEENQRPFPWRKNNDPYGVWLSEIILQQTRAAQGLPYFERFMATFPTVRQLAEASEDRVLKLWEGLGYYSRARNLHATAKIITDKYDGKFPKDFNHLKSLKGIGDYTASAIVSICFDQEQAVVDGNVYRMLSRIFGIDQPIDSSGSYKIFKEKAQQLIKGTPPGDFNQAMMEFGALQCKPQSPDCGSCPLSDSCWAFQHQKITRLPVKLPKKATKNRYFNYIIPLGVSDQTILVQRTQKDIWQKLYEFPLVETSELAQTKQFINNSNLPVWIDRKQLYLYNEKPWIHKLTHQHIHAYFWIAPKANPPQKLLVPIDSLPEFPVHRLIERFLHKFFD